MLDIIIPTYKDQEGLRATLNSINLQLLDQITVTVVDDNSNEDYSKLIEQFPFINLITFQKNSGPGIARQYGIINTNEPFLMFIDTGDLFISNEIQVKVLEELYKNPEENLFSWPHIQEKGNKISKEIHNRLHGRVYSRTFLKKYLISFAPEGSYANEDIGFNRCCKIILKSLNKEYKIYDDPLILWTTNENSLTSKNNGEFSYKNQNLGLAKNEIYLFYIAKINKVSEELLADEANEIIAAMHYNILKTSEIRPEFLQDAWDGAKLFYDTIFSQYETNKFSSLQVCFSNNIKRIRANRNKGLWKKDLPVNIRRFFADLKLYNQVPDWYK